MSKITFWVPVSYEMYGHIPVSAETEDEALMWAEEHCDELPLPDNAGYVEGSYDIDHDGLVYTTWEKKKGCDSCTLHDGHHFCEIDLKSTLKTRNCHDR